MIILASNGYALFTLAGELKNQGVTFSAAHILQWNEESFQGRTSYKKDGSSILASCDDSASGMVLRRSIDLRDTPIMEWSWRAGSNFNLSVDQTTKKGDDFVARIYVVKKGGLLPWDSYAINYVWAASLPSGFSWPNPFVKQVTMVAVRSGASRSPELQITERRNILRDFQSIHGRDIESIDAVAIMTDCDNGHGKARAWYGPIKFLSE